MDTPQRGFHNHQQRRAPGDDQSSSLARIARGLYLGRRQGRCQTGCQAGVDEWRAQIGLLGGATVRPTSYTGQRMPLDDHYERSSVEQQRNNAAEADRELRAHFKSLECSWSGAVGNLNRELATDLQRFVTAMKRHRGKQGVMPGAVFLVRRRPLGMGYQTSWFWRLNQVSLLMATPFKVGLDNTKDGYRAVAELVVTPRARVAVLYLRYRTHIGGHAKSGTELPRIDTSGKFVGEVPRTLFDPPPLTVAVIAGNDPRLAVERQFGSHSRRPPSGDEVNQLLASILHQHKILL